MTKRLWILNILGIWGVTSFLLPVWGITLKTDLLVVFILAGFLGDGKFWNKIWLVLLFLTVREFQSGVWWGLETLAVFLTILAMITVSRVVAFSSGHFLWSGAALLFWHYFYVAIALALEILVPLSFSGSPFLTVLQTGIGVWWSFWSSAAIALVFTLYFRLFNSAYVQRI